MNLVDDEWTRMSSYSALVGSPRQITMETVGDYVGELHALDYVRSERVRYGVAGKSAENSNQLLILRSPRKRCEEVVKDPATAKVRIMAGIRSSSR